MTNVYYSNSIDAFKKDDLNSILGEISRNNRFDLTQEQRKAWIRQIILLKEALKQIKTGDILFEYTIPRMGKRVDNVILYKGIIFILEFKVGESKFTSVDKDQVLDYSLDLKNFHEESHKKLIVPILLVTDGASIENEYKLYRDGIMEVVFCNGKNLFATMQEIGLMYSGDDIKVESWLKSRYRPTPTIIEAAQSLYRGHNIEEISRSDAGAKNINITTDYINRVIDYSKENGKKSICFLTGVPGSGKTLAGLNIASSRQKYEEEEHAVFLSGNGPLVKVLREALAREDNIYNGVLMMDARRKSSSFIQNVHHFRDDALKNYEAPIERVVIFDEAQRAWDKKKSKSFMRDAYPNFNQSEADFLISVMNRHIDWTVIICLIGGGQEIHTGEAGLREWFESISKYPDWQVHLSDKIIDDEYLALNNMDEIKMQQKYSVTSDLHLNTSIRSFRTEKLSEFVRALLNKEVNKSRELYRSIHSKFPIYITRDLSAAKTWLRRISRGTERYGLVASSDARRLKAIGLNVRSDIEVEHWFLGDKRDVRSSYYLEDVATEFDVQGLELDWTCLAWGGDFRMEDGSWVYQSFRGSTWTNINQENQRRYKKNTYRVLLTRARQGMVIFVPEASRKDHTRKSSYYDGTYKYLKSIGLEELDLGSME